MTYHIPMCVSCGDREVQIVVNSVGSGFCSTACEAVVNVEDGQKEAYDALLTEQYEVETTDEPPYGHDLDGYEYPEFDS
jgi:hypothetical protein